MTADRAVAEYRLGPAAQNDLDQIFDYTLHRWGMEQAIRYTRRLQKACAESAAAPLRAQDCSHIRHGYRRQPAERHFIYFRVADYGIAVIRILHQRMDEARHLSAD